VVALPRRKKTRSICFKERLMAVILTLVPCFGNDSLAGTDAPTLKIHPFNSSIFVPYQRVPMESQYSVRVCKSVDIDLS
jgi:hypothetical protein